MVTDTNPSNLGSMPLSPRPDADAAAEMRLQIEQMAEADNRLAKITRLAAFSSFNVKMLYLFGGLTIAYAAMNWGANSRDYFSPAVGLALMALGYFESRGRYFMLTCDPKGPRILSINQIAILVIVSICVGYAIYDAKYGPKREIESTFELLGGSAADARAATISSYKIILGLTAVFQVVMAWVYHRITDKLTEHVELTPPWILKVQRKRNC